jgi:hypothetical protein
MINNIFFLKLYEMAPMDMNSNSDNGTLYVSLNSMSEQISELRNLVNIILATVKNKEGENCAKLEDISKTLDVLKSQINTEKDDEKEKSKICEGRYISGRRRGDPCSALAIRGGKYCGKHSPGVMGVYLKNKSSERKKKEEEEEGEGET